MTYDDPRTPNPSDQPSFHWPPMPASPPPPQPPEQPAPKKKRTARNVALAVTGAVVLAVCGISTVGALVGGTPKTTGAISSDTTRDPTPEATTAVPTPTGELGVATPEPVQAAELTKADIDLTVKITRQKCFGSYGCNVTYTVEAAWPEYLVADGDTYLVTYEVWPVKDGPAVNNLTIVDASHYESENSELAQTTKRVKSLKVKITDVEKIGS
jgi:hypothetical protein